jgi:hypothetical protein
MKPIHRAIAALAAFAALSACSFQLGEPIDRSMRGLLEQTDTAPRGVSYILTAEYAKTSSLSALTPPDMIILPPFVGLTALREGQDFRLAPAAGSLGLPPQLISDSRSLYAIPGSPHRYVMEYNFVAEDGSRQLMATLAERRCQGDTCVLAIANNIPVNGDEGSITVPLASPCAEPDCDAPVDGQAFAAAVAQISARMRAEDFNDYFLIYQPAVE